MTASYELPSHSGRPELPAPSHYLAGRQEHTVPMVPLRARQAFEDDLEDEGLDLRELWLIVLKRRWTIIIFATIVMAAVITATYLKTPIYRASLTLQIDQEELNIIDVKNVSPSARAYYDYYRTQYELLRSRSLASRVVKQLGLADHQQAALPVGPSLFAKIKSSLQSWWLGTDASSPVPEPAISEQARMEAIVDGFLSGLAIVPVLDSQLVKLYYNSPDPKLASVILNNLAKAYINQSLERRFEATTYARNFLQERLQQVKIKLEESERALVEFARREQIINLDNNQSIVSEALKSINAALSVAERERIAAETLYRQMQGNRGQGLNQVLESVIIQELKQTKTKLEVDYQNGLGTYKPAYPVMVQLRNQIRQVDSMIKREIDNIRSAITADYKVAKAKEASLRANFEKTKKEMLALQDRSIQFNILRREADTNRELYDGLLQRFKEVGVASGVGKNNISIVDAADVPRAPFTPNIPKNVLIALILGLLGGIGLAFLFEYFDDTFRRADEVEKVTNLPVLGVIPMVRQESQDGRSIALVGHENPRSAFSESYRSVRTALQLSTASGVPRLLTVTSAIAGEGKSTTVVSLAIQFAQANKRTLLVESDLRKPSVHHALKLDNQVGLTNYLVGEDVLPEDLAQPTHIANLFAMPSGPLPPNPAELLSSARMATLLDLAAEKFDQVIVDSPPLLGLADALILGNLCQGTLLAVEVGNTPRGHVQSALKRLRSARVHVLGTILTKLGAQPGGYGYYRDYYQYYYSGYYSEEVSSGSRKLPAV